MDAGIIDVRVIVERGDLTPDELVQDVKDRLATLPAHSVGVEVKWAAVNGEVAATSREWEWLK